jgi:hypothetical protein
LPDLSAAAAGVGAAVMVSPSTASGAPPSVDERGKEGVEDAHAGVQAGALSARVLATGALSGVRAEGRPAVEAESRADDEGVDPEDAVLTAAVRLAGAVALAEAVFAGSMNGDPALGISVMLRGVSAYTE